MLWTCCHLRRYFIWIFLQEHLKLSNTDTQVGVIELVRNVPTQRSKLSPLLEFIGGKKKIKKLIVSSKFSNKVMKDKIFYNTMPLCYSSP